MTYQIKKGIAFRVCVSVCTHMWRCCAYAVHCSKKEAGLEEEFLIREKRERGREMSLLDTGLSLLLPQTTAFRLI